jgi:ribosomal protein L28
MRACEICEKSYKGGGTRKLLRGHHNPTAYGKKRANLQWAIDPKTGKRMTLCTKCIRTLSKTRKPKATVKTA